MGVLLVGIFFTGTAGANSVLYLATAESECDAAEFEVLSCGDFGPLLISDQAPPKKSDCAAVATMADEIGSYPVPSSIASRNGEYPCAAGRCFNAEPTGPWVAVVDWDGPHGWSVGETILQSSDGRVEARLYGLEDTGVEAIDGLAGAGDFHVLAQLCRVAEDARRRNPPLALNLSFGRLASPCEDESKVVCRIHSLIAGLRQRHGVITFAAAGNHGRLLFPAAVPAAIAVGSVDLRRLARHGEAHPIPQTPPTAAALFPGYGLFLEASEGGERWPAPPGSSYASALASGWFAGYRARYPRLAIHQIESCAETISPVPATTGHWLACGSTIWPGSRLEHAGGLMEIALGRRPGILTGETSPSLRALEIEGLARRLPERSFDEMQRDLNRPLPEEEPCVPCVGGGGGGGSQGLKPWSDGGPDVGTKSADFPTLTIDLSSARGLPQGLELEGVYLQVGREVYRFSDSENTTLLGDLALGEVDRIEIAAPPAGWRFRPTALVYALRLVGEDDLFCSSTPVLIHD